MSRLILQHDYHVHVFVYLGSHEVADIAGLASFSFGIEEEDRYAMLWKKVKFIFKLLGHRESYKTDL